MRNERGDEESLKDSWNLTQHRGEYTTKKKRCVCSKVEQNTLYVKFFFSFHFFLYSIHGRRIRKEDKKRRVRERRKKEQKFSGT
jgi:hypothetical protein